MSEDYGRVITAMATPFDDAHELDERRAAALARRLVKAGSDALLLCGTTGESPTLTRRERQRLVEAVVDAVGDEVFIWVGSGTNDTRASTDAGCDAVSWGADGVMLVVPYYNKPPQESLVGHFTRVAETVDRPVMLYNVPGRTGTNMVPETVARLAEHPRIVAIKEASGDAGQIADVRRLCPDDFVLYSGDDYMTLPALAVGARGVVSVAAHLVADELAGMVRAFQRGDHDEAKRVHLRLMPLFRSLFATTNPIPLKCALELSGFPVGPTRPPLWPAGERLRARLRQVLGALGRVPSTEAAEAGAL